MSWDFHSTITNFEASNQLLSGALNDQRHAVSGLTDAPQVTLPCSATQVGIEGHRDAPPTIVSWIRPVEASNTGLPTTPPEDPDIPP
eukprot:6337558-Amphidinium_carterae.1